MSREKNRAKSHSRKIQKKRKYIEGENKESESKPEYEEEKESKDEQRSKVKIKSEKGIKVFKYLNEN